jgi:asparagine synthase (glutamine-hydrolysing)
VCGIAGIVGIHAGIDRGQLDAMCRAIEHRGPDSDGKLVLDGPALSVGLGSRRLSIIDLSSAGDMPLSNETGDLWIVYNGELYNHSQLRDTLLALGHVYHSHTDTETIVHAYEEYGLDCLQRFNGMYAFALFDQRNQRVILARDPMGIKPLYYMEHEGHVLFCSELCGLLAALSSVPAVDPTALSLYLSLGYVPSPNCIYAGIRKLAPGSTLIIEDGTVTEHTFWTPRLRPSSATASDMAELVTTVRTLVEDSVVRQLMSEVPVGVFLSGGLDSSIITALAQKHHSGTLDTFSVGFGRADGGFDEHDLYNHDLMHAREVSAALGTRHHEVIVPTDHSIADRFTSTLAHIDEPTWESSFVSLSFMSQLAREHGVKVVLTGDGGDELFAGYPWYFGAQRFERMRRIPLLQYALPFLQGVAHNRPLGEKARDLRIRLRQDDVGRYRATHDIFSEAEKGALSGSNGQGVLGDPVNRLIAALFAGSGASTWAERLAIADLTLWVREHFNQRVDRMSMMHSVEARVPLQDQTVVDFALSVPLGLKLYSGQSKYLLRNAFVDVVPASVVRRPKRPFSVPAWTWLRGPMRDFTLDTLSRSSIQASGILDPNRVQQTVTDFMAGNDGLAFRVWTLLNLQAWMNRTRQPITH